jgi:ACS family hexuronate transporter-like MFS transporter
MYPVAGWIVDRFGARSIMLLGIIVWSGACLGAGLTRTLGQLAFFRGLLGLAEPLAFPAQLRVVATWFPGALRATANSICVAGTSIGAITAPPLVALLTSKYGWHMAFIVPALLGLAVAGLWRLIYRDAPPEIAAMVTKDAAATGTKFTWPQLWRTRSLWGILLCRFISDPVWYFCLFWLPGYLQENLGLTLEQTGKVAWVPYLAADLSAIGTALWSDRLVRRGQTPLRARKVMLTTVALLAPLCALTPHLPQVATTLIIFSVVGAVCLSWLFSMSVVIAEAFPQGNVGSVLGIAGGCGAVGGMLFNQYVGQMIGNIGAAKMFAVMAVLHPLAAFVLWLMVRREEPPPSAV